MMSDERFRKVMGFIQDKTCEGGDMEGVMDLAEIEDMLNELYEENEQLHYKLQQTKEYLQVKIDECKNHKKMEEIVFGVEQAVGYEKALLEFQKGLKRRLNDE